VLDELVECPAAEDDEPPQPAAAAAHSTPAASEPASEQAIDRPRDHECRSRAANVISR
jgi:hypothetical protein